MGERIHFVFHVHNMDLHVLKSGILNDCAHIEACTCCYGHHVCHSNLYLMQTLECYNSGLLLWEEKCSLGDICIIRVGAHPSAISTTLCAIVPISAIEISWFFDILQGRVKPFWILAIGKIVLIILAKLAKSPGNFLLQPAYFTLMCCKLFENVN
jgi:hypothetical protein